MPDLGRITVIGGKNNVGKTALLEALFLFLNRRDPRMILRQYGWRGIPAVQSKIEPMCFPIFRNFDVDEEISIAVELDGKKEAIKYRYNPQFRIPAVPAKETTDNHKEIRTDQEATTSSALDIEYDDGAEQLQTGHLFVDQEGQIGLQWPNSRIAVKPGIFLPAKVHINSKDLAGRFSKFAKKSKENEVIEFLKIIESRLCELKVIIEGPYSAVEGAIEGLSVTLPIALMGEGMGKLLSVILSIADCEQGTVFIDEIENGLHYSVMSKIWEAIAKAAKKYDCQVIATTHSYECLEAAHKGLIDVADEFRYIRLDRKDDKITAKTSNYEMLGTAISSNLEVR